MKLFEEAENAYKSFGETTPICLFDEAESLLYPRNLSKGGAVEHMNNNMVSLLLQALEKFNGILFCCTNFTVQDFDPAIARRFHQTVRVTAPHQDILQNIFSSRFPEFTDGQAKEFIEHYNKITPAEIELLKNKYQVQMIVNEGSDANSLLYQVAEQVTASKYRPQTQIGFRL
jgi:hypothetical protein